MRLFAIDNDNTITAFPAAEQIPEGQEHFATEKELAKLAANWPADRLVQVWNSFAGVAGFGGDLKPIKKFTDRKSAVARIWKAIQKLDAPAAPETAAATETATTAPRRPTVRRRSQGDQGGQDQGRRARGARRQQEGHRAGAAAPQGRRDAGRDRQATDWQTHSIRGFISGSLTKKMGLKIESIKREDGERRYVLAQ